MRTDYNAVQEINEYFLDASSVPTAPARPDVPTTPVGTNRATPLELAKLLDELQELTDAIEQADQQRQVAKWCMLPPVSPIPCAQDGAQRYDERDPDLEDDTTRQLRRWQARLAWMFDQVNEAPAEDREAVLYTVTAPLLLGWHYREQIPDDVIAEGYGDVDSFGQWWELQHVPDVATPLMLGRAVNVDHHFTRTNTFTSSLTAAMKDYAADAGRVLAKIGDKIAAAGDAVKDNALWVVGVVALGALGFVMLRK